MRWLIVKELTAIQKGGKIRICGVASTESIPLHINSLTVLQTTTFSIQIFKNVKPKLHHIENSKARGQKEEFWMRLLIMSHLIKIYAVCEFSCFRTQRAKSATAKNKIKQFF